jgi:hypothetical protein
MNVCLWTRFLPMVLLTAGCLCLSLSASDYPVVDTEQKECYDDSGAISFPLSGQAFHGQDAQYVGALCAYQDNGDGTVADLQTGLMWQQDPGSKMTWYDAVAGASSFYLAGYTDWRLPTIKELYSLIRFNGYTGMTAATSRPYIDTDFFVFEYGDENAGERFIDAQYCSATEYVGFVFQGDQAVFGVNFADGRIKGYPKDMPWAPKEFFVRYVRGNTNYGVNDFVDNSDGTITDQATGLMWMQVDSGAFGAGPNGDGTLNWEQALDWAENLNNAGYDDWRLPNAKELQSLVDYTRAPLVTGTAAIDVNYFDVTETESFFWANTTHCDGPSSTYGEWGVYVAFGRAMGYMETPPGSGIYQYLDVHGAGAQRGDPKSGDPNDPQWQYGNGPQGDEVRIYNYVRCVRGGNDETFAADAYTLSASAGGTITFTLDAGSANANRYYLLCGSVDGILPGTLLPGNLATIPLNRDWFTGFVLARLGQPAFREFWGILDGAGQATAHLYLPSISSAWVETDIYFAFATVSPWDFASKAVAVEVEQ